MTQMIERDFKEAYKMMKERALDAEHEARGLRLILKAVDYTLTVHGHIDRETPLHDRITKALSVPNGERK